MYRLNEKAEKKIRYLVKSLKVMFIFSFILYTLGILLILFGNGRLINILPLLIFVLIWMIMFNLIYSFLAYKIPIQILQDQNKLKFISIKKVYIFEFSELFERCEGVNYIIINTRHLNKVRKFYLPRYFGNKKILDDHIFSNIIGVKNSKIYYDFFIRFF